MRTKAALPKIQRDIAQFFADNATDGLYSAITTSIAPGVGAASFTAGATEPTSDYEVRIDFTVGGTVGVDGIKYRLALDTGAPLGPELALGTATHILVPNANSGVRVELGVGTIPTGQILTFTTEGPRRKAPVLFGWKEYSKQINQGPGGASRVVVVPGTGPGKWSDGAFRRPLVAGDQDLIAPPAVGADAPAGLRGRHILDWNRTAFFSIWGVDPARPQDDTANYEAVDRLLEDVIQGIQGAAAGKFTLGTPEWTAPLEQQFGRHLVVPATLRGTLYDIPNSTVAPKPAVHRNPPT